MYKIQIVEQIKLDSYTDDWSTNLEQIIIEEQYFPQYWHISGWNTQKEKIIWIGND